MNVILGDSLTVSARGLLEAIAQEVEPRQVERLARGMADLLDDQRVCEALAALAQVLAMVILQKVPDDEKQTAVLEGFPVLTQAMMATMGEDGPREFRSDGDAS